MKNKNIFEVSATVFLLFMPNRQTKHLWLFKQIKFLSLSGSFIHLRALKTCWLKHVCSYCFCFFCYKFTDNQLAFKMSMGDSRILATSKATLPCPNMTAVSQLRSGLSWRKKSNRWDREAVFLVKWSNFVEALFDGWKHLVCLCETLTWKSYLSTAGESVVPAHKVFGRVHTSQVFARYSHAPVSLCTITLSHNLQSSTETDDYFSHV